MHYAITKITNHTNIPNTKTIINVTMFTFVTILNRRKKHNFFCFFLSISQITKHLKSHSILNITNYTTFIILLNSQPLKVIEHNNYSNNISGNNFKEAGKVTNITLS